MPQVLTPPTRTDSADDLVRRGHARYKEYDYERAITHYTRALTLSPDDAMCYVFRARARRFSSDLRGAIADYSHALQLDPSLSFVYYERAEVRKKTFDLLLAIADYEQFLADCNGLCEDERAEVQQSIRDLRKELGE